MSEKDIHKEENDFSGDENSSSFSDVPANYFQDFSSRLFKKIEANNELNDYAFLSSINKQNPFTVPQGYFNETVNVLQYPTLHSLPKTQSFITPVNYFDVLEETITTKILIEEEISSYPTLSAIPKQNVFEVPADYFIHLSETIQDKIDDEKVVPLYNKKPTVYKFAAAAAVLLLIGFGILFYNNQKQVVPQPSTDCASFACLTKQEILNSSYIMHTSEENIIDLIDEKNLNDTLLLKENGKTLKLNADDVSNNIDINTLTDQL